MLAISHLPFHGMDALGSRYPLIYKVRLWKSLKSLPVEQCSPHADYPIEGRNYALRKVISMCLFDSGDPRFNGLHVCPRCGADSIWEGVEKERRLIRVVCEGACEPYEESYANLSDSPHFQG